MRRQGGDKTETREDKVETSGDKAETRCRQVETRQRQGGDKAETRRRQGEDKAGPGQKAETTPTLTSGIGHLNRYVQGSYRRFLTFVPGTTAKRCVFQKERGRRT